MPSRELYRIKVPEDSIQQSRDEQRTNIASSGTVSTGEPFVEAISTQAGQTEMSGQYRGLNADKLAKEFEQLFSSSDIESVPYYGTEEKSFQDGYYTLDELIEVGPLSRDEPRVQTFRGRATKIGTKKTHWRAVKTSPTTITNPFGDVNEAVIGIPAGANKVRWYDSESNTLEAPSGIGSTFAEFGSVDKYNALTASFDNPTMIYEIDYDLEGQLDSKVWDTLGNDSKFDGDGNLQWQKVFSTEHEFVGEVVLSNAEWRVFIDEDNQTMSAQQYGSGSWNNVALGSSNWIPYDVDVYDTSPLGARAQVEFENTGAGEDFYRLNMSFFRGWGSGGATSHEGILISDPPTQTTILNPGLNSLLEPIASERTIDPDPTRALVRRSEVRK